MARSDNQKLKILYILDYLQKNSHQEHPVRATELAEMLEKRGIPCDRKTIYSDIAALQDFGIDILTCRGKGGGYYIGEREFQLPELKLLIGAVQSSRFLTEGKSLELIEKLSRLCSQQEAEQVRRNVVVAGRIKNMNQSIYYDVDTIQEAIFQNRQISFRYFDWGIDGRPKYRDKDYTASPYGLYQDNENCYLLALSPRHGVTAYRVDRMTHIALLPAARQPCPELTGQSLNDYAQKRFQMFNGDTVSVKMRFHRSLTNVVMDRFGNSTMLFPDGEDHFVFTVDVAESPMFLSWVIGFGDKAQILYPPRIRAAVQDLCREVLAQYGSDDSGSRPKDENT